MCNPILGQLILMLKVFTPIISWGSPMENLQWDVAQVVIFGFPEVLQLWDAKHEGVMKPDGLVQLRQIIMCELLLPENSSDLAHQQGYLPDWILSFCLWD